MNILLLNSLSYLFIHSSVHFGSDLVIFITQVFKQSDGRGRTDGGASSKLFYMNFNQYSHDDDYEALLNTLMIIGK